MLVTYNAGAGSLTEFQEAGDFFRLMRTEVPVTVYFYTAGREVARAEGVSGGYAEKFAEVFDRIAIVSPAAQSIQLVTRYGNVVHFDAPPMGLVTVANTGGDFVQSQKTVTDVSGHLLPAKGDRRYLLIQNNASNGNVFITLDGAAATAARGVKIGPGGALELSAFCPRGEVHAIGSIPNNAAVVVVEG